MSRLLIQQYEIGPLNNFVYLLGDTETREMAVVDPAWDVGFLCQEAKRLGYTMSKVLLTHTHPDHINGLKGLLSICPVPVYISRHEPPSTRPPVGKLIEVTDNDHIPLGNIDIKVLHTPGHAPGCQCFLVEGHLISGDTLFIDGCGRCDLPGSDPEAMYNSLYHVLAVLPDDTIVCSGHNYGATPTDTIGHQKQTNPYLQSKDLHDFLSQRMGL